MRSTSKAAALAALGWSLLVGPESLAAESLRVDAADFGCISDLAPVRGFFVGNLVGDLDATLAVARSAEGGAYPPGSVVQLVPTEAMVKHPEGFNPATRDWDVHRIGAPAPGLSA
jgi:hypothetical protein